MNTSLLQLTFFLTSEVVSTPAGHRWTSCSQSTLLPPTAKTADTAIVIVCVPATKISPTAVPSPLTSLLVVDGMKIVESEIEKKKKKQERKNIVVQKK